MSGFTIGCTSGSVIPLPPKQGVEVNSRLYNRPNNAIENATVGDRRYNRGAVIVLFIARGFERDTEITHEGGVFALTRFLVRLPQQ